MSAQQLFSQALNQHSAGKLGEAESLYRQVLAQQPGHSMALANLGVIANQMKKHQMAEQLFEKALARDPNNAGILTGLGNARGGLGRCADAINCYHQALAIKPDHAEAHYNMAMEQMRLNQPHAAIASLKNVVKLVPDAFDAYNALGSALDQQGEYEEAIKAYRHAIRARPDYAMAHNNLGNTLLAMGKADMAVPCYRAAIKHKPDFVEALFNLGNALLELKRVEHAIAAFTTVVQLRPDLTEAQFNLARAQQQVCDWSQSTAGGNAFLSYMYKNPGRVDPFFLLSQESSHEDQLLCAQYFAKRFAVPASAMFTHKVRPEKRKIRIGYISGNFQQHPNSFLSVGLFEQHDRERFEVIGYSYGQDDGSDIRKRVAASFDRFVDIHALTHAQAAQRIYDDGIDILIDRQGYTTRHRMGIAAHRPAPIQVNYLGYPGTMGASYLDYIIVDPFVVTADQQRSFIEKLVYLPECYQSTDSRQDIAEEVPTRAELGLPEDGFVFCCFNNTYKIRPAFFDVWMRLLDKTPGSVLWLLDKNPLVQNNLRREAKARGIAPERIVFARQLPHAQHLARQKLADLFLDTLPYNAHTTASDALWVGLPVLTCVGQTFAGRVAGSILHAAGLPELICYSLADYEKMALELAQDAGKLSAIRRKVEQAATSSSLFDTTRYTRHMEDAYTRMWELYQKGEAPQLITVAARP